MPKTELAITRIRDLIGPREELAKVRRAGNRLIDVETIALATGWMTSVLAAVRAIVPRTDDPHYVSIRRQCDGGPHQISLPVEAANTVAVLKELLINIDHGLLGSLIEGEVSLIFDDFFDHASELLKGGYREMAGVVGGVTFEDAMRRAYASRVLGAAGAKLEDIISALSKDGLLTNVAAKRARSAAAVRTSATHARWEEFTASDVEACIVFGREFVQKGWA